MKDKKQRMDPWEAHRQRSAVGTAIAVALYILCVVPLIVLGSISDTLAMVGLCIMFVMAAVATAILVWLHMSKPAGPRVAPRTETACSEELSATGEYCEAGRSEPRTTEKVAHKAVSGVLWGITVCGYFVLSFMTGAWYITWLLFVIAGAVDNVIKACFDLLS